MTFAGASLIAVCVLFTSFVSGIFGMAGGMILMGLLLLVLTVPAAMVVHGVAQLASNASRAILWRQYVVWPIVGRYLIGAAAVVALFAIVRFVPNEAVVFIILGAMPFAAQAVPAAIAPRADRRFGSEICGIVTTGLNLLAGVGGPALDIFFVRTQLDRRAIVATKAACMASAHIAKLLYFGSFLIGDQSEVLPVALMVFVIISIIGTNLSKTVLERMSDGQFRKWTQVILMGIGAIYLVKGVSLLF